MDRFILDLRHAARGLRKSPMFTLGVMLTLAMGIGVNATMFTVVDALFMRTPVGVTNTNDIVRIYYRQTFAGLGTFTQPTTSYPTFTALRDGVPGFAQIAAIWTGEAGLGRGTAAIRVRAAAVSPQYFPLLGVQPERGRFFSAEEDRPGGERVAVLSHGFWQRHFGGDPAIVGRSLTLGKNIYTVIGVGPVGFNGIESDGADVFLPIAVAGNEVMGREVLDNPGWSWLHLVARLRSDVERTVVSTQATRAFRQSNSVRRRDSTSQVVLGPIQEARGPNLSEDAKVSLWTAAVSLIVLLIACANVANLLLVRGIRRQREFALRASLGAGRSGLIRMLLLEGLLLAAGGGLMSLLFAMWAGAAARGFLLASYSTDIPNTDRRMLVVTAIVVVVTALLIGLGPALQATRTDLIRALRAGGRGATMRAGRARSALLVAQVALTMVLLVGAGLFVRSLHNARAVDLGLDVERMLAVSINFEAAGFSQSEATATWSRILDRVQNLPGVEHAAISMGTPFYGWMYGEPVRVDGRDSLPNSPSGLPTYQVISPDYMGATGIRMVEGRAFTTGDVPGSGAVTIIGAAFAKAVWPHESPIGKCLYTGDGGGTCRRIVGVATDVRASGVRGSEGFVYYLPFAQADQPHVTALLVRTVGNPALIAATLRREVQAVDNLPYVQIEPMADRVVPEFRSWRIGSAAFSVFGLLALIIAAAGIFAVLSYTVNQRVQEIGVRVALGAHAHHVIGMIVAQGLRIAVAGIAIGSVAALIVGRAIASLLYEVPPSDLLVFTATVITLALVALAAAYVPAHRAARVAPIIALQSD